MFIWIKGSYVLTGKPHSHCHRRTTSPSHRHRREKHRAELISTVSTLYAKLLIVVGVIVPLTASVSQRVPAALDQVIIY